MTLCLKINKNDDYNNNNLISNFQSYFVHQEVLTTHFETAKIKIWFKISSFNCKIEPLLRSNTRKLLQVKTDQAQGDQSLNQIHSPRKQHLPASDSGKIDQ